MAAGEANEAESLSRRLGFRSLLPGELREQLQEQLSAIRSLRAYRTPLSQGQKRKLTLWQRRTVALLQQAFGEDSDQAAFIDEIEFEPESLFGIINTAPLDATYRNGLDTAEAVLKTALDVELGSRATRTHGRSPTAFISASFDVEADSVVKWFCELSRAVGFQVVWLKDFAEPRPPAEKVKEYLKNADCLIQILTEDVIAKAKDRGWIGNEIAWSVTDHGKGRQALFVERGLKATGIAREITESVEFDRNRLHEIAPRAVAYLMKLRSNIS